MPLHNQILDKDSWNIFNLWDWKKDVSKTKYDWHSFDKLIFQHNIILKKEYEEFLPLLDKWNHLLKDLDGDPTYINWDNFRPLRLSREEDWADWLAFLLERSVTGIFAKDLLKIPNIDFSNPKKVLREDIYKGYRADLIIEWKQSKFTHIEVKIGDPNLVKTFPTSEAFLEKFRIKQSNWTNFILLLSSQVPEWEYIVETINSGTIINFITWEDICISLRRSLLGKESKVWKVWAYTFLGAVEQLIIGYPGYLLNKDLKPKDNIDKKKLILEKSLYYEQRD